MNFDNTKLDKLLRQLRKIKRHRSVSAEKQIRKIYKQILAEIKLFLSDAYINYAINDQLTYATLQQYGYYARFIEEVEEKLSGISSQISNEITKKGDGKHTKLCMMVQYEQLKQQRVVI